MAIMNAQACMTYLATFYTDAYISLDINTYNVRLHFFDPTKTDEEIRNTAKSTFTIAHVGSEIEFEQNKQLECITFDITWPITD